MRRKAPEGDQRGKPMPVMMERKPTVKTNERWQQGDQGGGRHLPFLEIYGKADAPI